MEMQKQQNTEPEAINLLQEPNGPNQPPAYQFHAHQQTTPGYPQQPIGGYPMQPTKGDQPGSSYPIGQGQGNMQQPGPISSNNTTQLIMTQPAVFVSSPPYLDDHMGLSICACLCCCWCIGLFAIMKSSEARNRNLVGDYEGALESAQSAKRLAIWSIMAGFIFVVIVIVIRVIAITKMSY